MDQTLTQLFQELVNLHMKVQQMQQEIDRLKGTSSDTVTADSGNSGASVNAESAN